MKWTIHWNHDSYNASAIDENGNIIKQCTDKEMVDFYHKNKVKFTEQNLPVIITDGSSDGHHGTVQSLLKNGAVRVLRDDGRQVDIPSSSYIIKKDQND